MAWRRRPSERLRAGLAAAAVLLAGGAAAQPTTLRFTLPAEATTSAGLLDADGRLLRTLWSAQRLPAGEQVRRVEVDATAPRALTAVLIHHDVRAVWEGVVGNSSSAVTGPGVHRAFQVPGGLAIAGERVYYAAGYNEGQRTLHAFDAREPQRALRPFDHVDPFVGLALVAADGARVYAANTGGLSRTSFVMAFDVARGQPLPWPAGQPLCLNRRPDGSCYANQDYRGVIDVATDAADVPTGLAVQSRGSLLAVARGRRQQVQLFDKLSGRPVGAFAVPLEAGGRNVLAFAPDGDLWVLLADRAVRYALGPTPRPVATLAGLVRPLAIAVHPDDEDAVWVAEGGARQQLRRFDRQGRPRDALGVAGGYRGDPAVSDERLCFEASGGQEQTGLAVAADGALWVADTCNNRLLRWSPAGRVDAQVAYLPAVYAAAADAHDARRVFANFLEFDVDADAPLAPGRWRLVRNWLVGLPATLRDAETGNRGFAGFRCVTTLAGGRRYGLLGSGGRDALVELPEHGPLRLVKLLARPVAGATAKVLYENGDLGWALLGGGTQKVLRQRLLGLDAAGDPQWAAEPELLASVPMQPGTPYDRGAPSGLQGPRFPVLPGGQVVFFDPSVVGNEGFHLGAARLGARDWLWLASPSAPLDGRGSFQTREADRRVRAADRGIQYGGNVVMAVDRHIVYGFHGEFYTDQSNGRVGQANQFMHFHDSGLFIGQFGRPSTRATEEAEAGLSGNAFSPSLVAAGARLYLYHNDESAHGGVHRWRLDGWQAVRELRGTGPAGGVIELR